MDYNMTSFETGSLGITAAGTAEQLTAHRIPQGYAVTLRARVTNTGYIYIGESKAKAEAHHIMLEAGASIPMQINDVSGAWADCSVNGETVEWILEVSNDD